MFVFSCMRFDMKDMKTDSYQTVGYVLMSYGHFLFKEKESWYIGFVLKPRLQRDAVDVLYMSYKTVISLYKS